MYFETGHLTELAYSNFPFNLKCFKLAVISTYNYHFLNLLSSLTALASVSRIMVLTNGGKVYPCL